MPAAQPSVATPYVLRTAAVWGTFVLACRDLRSGQSLVLGESTDALVNKPEGSAVVDHPIRASGSGWELDIVGCTGGFLRLRGCAEDPLQLAQSGAPVPIATGDHGLIQYGNFSVFFQFSAPARPPRAELRFDWSLLLSFAFSLITVGGALLLSYLLFPVQPLPVPLELISPEELQVRYRVTPPVEQSVDPGEAEEGEAGPKPEDAAAKRARTKRKDSATPVPRPSKAGTTRRAAPAGTSAMTDALQGDVGKQVLEALGTISSVPEALGGLAASPIVLGSSSAGSAGLQGSAGGLASGSSGAARYGAGTLKTGLGADIGTRGRGTGNGSGSSGGGERKLAVEQATPKGQSLSRAQVSRVINSRARAFQACYETALARSPGLQGSVTVQLTIGGGGKVSQASVANSSLGSKRVEGCLLRMFRRLRFPRADLESRVNWPIVFKGKR